MARTGGRPSKKYNQEHAKIVQSLAQYGIPHAQIAAHIGVSKSTLLALYSKEIEEGAFSGCTALMTINALATTPSELEEEAFDTKQYLRANVYVPRGTLDDYIASSWGNFANLYDTLDPSSVGLMEDGSIDIHVENGCIVVDGINGDTHIEVYNIGGQLIYQGSDTSISVPASGVYIIRTQGETVKLTINN